MIVKSQNPIFIDSPTGMINTSRSNVRNRVNSRSNVMSNFNNYSYFDSDGKPQNKAEVMLFQDWLDANYPTWMNGGKLNKGQGYGRYPLGPSTEKAWKDYGGEFVKYGRSIAQQTLNLTLPITNPNLAVTDPQGNKKPGQFWDKIRGLWVKAQESGLLTSAGNFIRGNQPQGNWQGMDPTMQGQGGMQPQPEPEKKGMSGGTIALIIGGVAVVGVLLYLMTKTDAPAQAPAPAK